MIHLIYKKNGIEYSWLNCNSKRIFEMIFKTLGSIEVIKMWVD